MHVLIVGGGWAGLSAAVHAAQRGWQVTILEASRQLGGRARTLHHHDQRLDNGQHILIGAYTDTLSLMRTLGLNPDALLHRLPLTLRHPDGSGLTLPDLPPPWNLLIGVLRARGWTWKDRLSLLRGAWQWQRQDFACDELATVADLCRPLTPRVMEQLMEPLCVSALNTSAQAASGAVFLRVLRDALWSGSGGSDLLLPKTDLGSLMPHVAQRWLCERGATFHFGHRATTETLAATATGEPLTNAATPAESLTHGASFAEPMLANPPDAIVLACPAWEAARLTASHHSDWSAQAQALHQAAITTVYVQHPDPNFPGLPLPMMALPSDTERPAQFVFDRGQLMGPSQRGLLACVVSDSTGSRETLEQQVLVQLQEQLTQVMGSSPSHGLQAVKTVVEKRATFVCSPRLQRPAAAIGQGWWACGDYVQGPYPATLEGAVRSGREVIDQIAQAREREGRL